MRVGKIRTVLFDLGNVLVHIDPEAPIRVLGISSEVDLRLYKKYIPEYVYHFEKGNLVADQLFDLLGDIFENRYTYEEMRYAFMSIIGHPVAGMDAIIKKAAQKAHVALASNTNDLHFDHCRRAVPAVRLLHHHYLSYQIGALKPDAEFYRHIINDLEADPETIFFIDDRQENVTAAMKEGIRAHRFTSIEVLKGELRSLGLL
jgi:putative hydrolase of the HAD superfamily